MRILFIAALPPPTHGQSLACQVLLEELRKDYKVEVVNLSKSTLTRGITSFRDALAMLLLPIKVLAKRSCCDVVYFTVSQSVLGNIKDIGIYLALGAKLRHTVIHLHGGAGMANLLSNRHRVLRGINRWIFQRLAGIIVLGSRHLPMFEGLAPPHKLRIVANFAEDSVFIDDDSFEQKFSAFVPLRLLFLSNFNHGKGYAELLEAIRLLPAERRNVLQMDFAGAFESSSEKDEFLAAIKEFPQLHYQGVVSGSTKVQLFQRAHVFLLPTYYSFEGQPISILEAYAAGCAVVTTNHGGIFDVFTPGINGYAVEKRSPRAIADAIEAAIADRDALRRFATANRDEASRLFRTSVFAKKVKTILNEAAKF